MVERRVIQTSVGKVEVIRSKLDNYDLYDYWIRRYVGSPPFINAIYTHDGKIKGIGSTKDDVCRVIIEAVYLFKETVKSQSCKKGKLIRIK